MMESIDEFHREKYAEITEIFRRAVGRTKDRGTMFMTLSLSFTAEVLNFLIIKRLCG